MKIGSIAGIPQSERIKNNKKQGLIGLTLKSNVAKKVFTIWYIYLYKLLNLGRVITKSYQ